jgi:hypothetical protein
MPRVLRFGVVVLFAVVALATTVYAVSSPRTAAQNQVVELGVVPPNRNAFEFAGRIEQDGTRLTSYGYVTYLAGANDALLFTTPLTRTEATARLTFSGTAMLTGRSVISNIFTINATGEPKFYFHANGGASFDNPASFAQGPSVATQQVRFHNILTVIAPNTGISSGIGELTQTAAGQFTHAGQSYTFGRSGVQGRASFSAFGIRTEPAIPLAVLAMAGDSVVTGYDTNLPLLRNAR